MVKVKMLSRNPDHYKRETKMDIQKVPRNFDPAMHPFQAQREYVRASNATKLDRVFAKPFLAAMDMHRDGVSCMAKNKTKLNSLFSGSYDGEIIHWNLTTRVPSWRVQAHNFVRGLTTTHDGLHVVSVGDDTTVKMWSSENKESLPVNTYISKVQCTGVDSSWTQDQFVTSGQDSLDLWNYYKAEPLRTFEHGNDTFSSVRFNPIDPHLFLATSMDRSILLYDVRKQVPLVNKMKLSQKSNVAVWNPMEAYVFTAANEDANLYSYDIRKFDMAMCVHQDHTQTVLTVDYSPTGKEFVTGSYDKTIRIFPSLHGRSREVYHTKRMQKVTSVQWSADSKYILSGSDETNIRLWKAKASEKLGLLAPREKRAFDESAKLRRSYQHHPEIRRIAKHRHLPKGVYNQVKERREMINAAKKKENNRRMNSAPGQVPRVPERKRQIVGVLVEEEASSDEE